MIHCWAQCMQSRTLETRKTLAIVQPSSDPRLWLLGARAALFWHSECWSSNAVNNESLISHYLGDRKKFHFLHSHTLLTFKQNCMRQVRKTLKIMLCSKRLPSFPTEWILCPSDPPSVLLPPQPASSPALGAQSFTSCPYYQARPLFSNL